MKQEDLRKWREARSLTQGELGKALGVTLTTVYRWEAGHRKIPPFLQLALEGLERRAGEKAPKGRSKENGGGVT
jgi:DNA-binding XRE family transcriptional regulator